MRIEDLKRRARELKTEVQALALALRHPGTPWLAKLLAAAIVAYALSPIDLVPDFIPVLGFLDELLLLPLCIIVVRRMVPPDVMAECRARATGKPTSLLGKIGATVIVVLWLAIAALAASWLVSD